MEKEIIERLAQEAIGLVTSVRPEYQVEAFGVIFDRLLEPHLEEKEGGQIKAKKKTILAGSELGVASNNFARMMETPWDYSRYAQLVESGTWADRAIVVLAAAEEEFGINSLTPTEVASVLRTRMRIESVYDSNVSGEMRLAKLYLSRYKDGKAYRYSLTKAGRDRLKELLEKNLK